MSHMYMYYASSEIDVQIWFCHFGTIYARRVVLCIFYFLRYSSLSLPLARVDSKPKIHSSKFFSLCVILHFGRIESCARWRNHSGLLCVRMQNDHSSIFQLFWNIDKTLTGYYVDLISILIYFVPPFFRYLYSSHTHTHRCSTFVFRSTTFSATLFRINFGMALNESSQSS